MGSRLQVSAWDPVDMHDSSQALQGSVGIFSSQGRLQKQEHMLTLQTYILTYLRIYLPIYMTACIHTNRNTYMHTYIQIQLPSYITTYVRIHAHAQTIILKHSYLSLVDSYKHVLTKPCKAQNWLQNWPRRCPQRPPQ